MLRLIIRTETVHDHEEVSQINVAAFGGRDDESRLIERIRGSEGFVPELSIVAVRDNRIFEHALFSEAVVVDKDDQGTERKTRVIVLAPIAVHPDHQKQGIGQALIQEGFRRVSAMGYPLVLLIGHPSYYPKLGFQPARPHGLELKQFPVDDPVFMVYEAIPGQLGNIRGELRYPPSFF